MGAVWVVVGENFRFGRGAVGDAALLAALGERLGFGVTAVPLQRVDSERVSSSWIRELVSKGEVEHAARLLGRDPWLEGVVERGDARGRELGVPTANLAIERGSVRPARGVYAGMAVLQDGRRVPAAISVGWNPTFGEGRPLTVEAHLLDFSDDLYDQPLRLEFRRFLRHELRFESWTSWWRRCSSTSRRRGSSPRRGDVCGLTCRALEPRFKTAVVWASRISCLVLFGPSGRVHDRSTSIAMDRKRLVLPSHPRRVRSLNGGSFALPSAIPSPDSPRLFPGPRGTSAARPRARLPSAGRGSGSSPASVRRSRSLT